jgi:hypothetical protein
LYSLREGVYEVVNAALTNAALEIRNLHKQVRNQPPSMCARAVMCVCACAVGCLRVETMILTGL